ncbi:MAG: FAD-dependent oxidoreductase [Sulfuricurvum sp.]|nr:FAD-dependent oxidoreductase [Sulfuricurvum sp.]
MKRHRVVIVGGGYAGVKALNILATSGVCDIVLIDQHPYHYLQTDAYELIANECSMTTVTIDLVALCLSYGEHVLYVKDTVREIDFANRHVLGENSGHPYDYLLLCAGSRTAYQSSIVGLREHSHGVKTLLGALSFKQQFEQRLYEKMESEGGWRNEPFNIVIGGGGLSGVEIAAEMAFYIRQFHLDNTLTCDNLHIFLIIPHENVLDGMETYMVQQATKRLLELGVKIINHSRITSVEEHLLILNEKESLCFDFMIFAGGIVASTLTASLDVPKNKKGQLIVDEYLSLPPYENVFAVGDIAQLRDKQGNIIPPTAQSAEQSGICGAKNILALMHNKKRTAADLRMRGTLIALGGPYACASLFGWIRLSGLGGYWVKTIAMGFYRYRINAQCARGLKRLQKKNPSCRKGF